MLVNKEVMKFQNMTVSEIQDYIRNSNSEQDLWIIALYFTHTYRWFWIKKKKSIAPFEEVEDYLNRVCEVLATNFLKHFVKRDDRFFVYSKVSQLLTLALHTLYKGERKKRRNQCYWDSCLEESSFTKDEMIERDVKEELCKQLKVQDETYLQILTTLSHYKFSLRKTAAAFNCKLGDLKLKLLEIQNHSRFELYCFLDSLLA